jgi:hypothetical protein
VYQYSGADLKQIRALPQVKAKWSRSSKTSVVEQQAFPAMSVTLFALRDK